MPLIARPPPPTAWRLLRDSDITDAPAGCVVYAAEDDMGMAAFDTKITGTERVSVSLRDDGGFPFFTVPRADLEELP